MNKLLISLALAGATITGPVAAQTLPPAVIVIVNQDAVFQNSAAGKQALVELKTRADAVQARLQTLNTSFGTEQQALVNSRPTAPGAAATAWEAKAKDFQTRKTQAEQEIAKRGQDLDLSRQYVVKQLTDAMNPIISTIMKERGASIVLAEGATLQHTAAIDVTDDIIARLNTALPRVVTTAPAAPAR